MSPPNLAPLEVDSVEITSLMDNFFDAIIASTEVARRPPRSRDFFSRPQPRAEHGSAMLVTVEWDGHRESLLLDTGGTPNGMLHNIDTLGIEVPPLRAIVISHGHMDHTAGLWPTLERFGRDIPVHIHPAAFRRRKNVAPDGSETDLPPVEREALAAQGVRFVVSREPSLLLFGHVLLTGEVARTTDFERGLPTQLAEVDGQWQPDPATHDDQALIIQVRDKGLVVVTGCGHAGIVNTIRYAQALTGVEVLYAAIGGFHLSGGIFEKIIPQTVEELEGMAPQIVVPTHCTGWKASHAIAATLPWAFIPNSVGTKYVL
jgi:7,8-dihydropterin-6-yl-methyl-4-(beta-D-ribofuranosyl)aminobenzene 5'-phosphate synthase